MGGDAIFITTDVSHAREVKAMIERTLATLDRLDGAFNNAGITPTRIHIGATVKLEKVGEGFSITTIELDTEADIPGMDDATFQRYALDAKQNCPVSKALAGTAIRLNAKLL